MELIWSCRFTAIFSVLVKLEKVNVLFRYTLHSSVASSLIDGGICWSVVRSSLVFRVTPSNIMRRWIWSKSLWGEGVCMLWKHKRSGSWNVFKGRRYNIIIFARFSSSRQKKVLQDNLAKKYFTGTMQAHPVYMSSMPAAVVLASSSSSRSVPSAPACSVSISSPPGAVPLLVPSPPGAVPLLVPSPPGAAMASPARCFPISMASAAPVCVSVSNPPGRVKCDTVFRTQFSVLETLLIAILALVLGLAVGRLV